MQKIRTYVFMFVPIPSEWIAPASVARGSGVGSNGSSLRDHKHRERSQWRGRRRKECDTHTLPGYLFWTWFVDNQRASRPQVI